MFGLESRDRFPNVPIAEFIRDAAAMPADTGAYQARLAYGTYGDVSYTDFLSLIKVEGTWKIVNKLFVSTAGHFPD